MKEITAETLRTWRRREGMTQEQLGKLIGLQKVAITKIEGGQRQISAAEQKLLQLLIHGHDPFHTPRIDARKTELSFTEEEWTLIHRTAKREGHEDAKQWIVNKIRSYLRMNPQTAHEQIAAEEAAPYNQRTRPTTAPQRSK